MCLRFMNILCIKNVLGILCLKMTAICQLNLGEIHIHFFFFSFAIRKACH